MVLPLFTASSPKWHCTLNTTHLNDLSDLNHTAANSSLANCQLRRLGICDEVVYDEKFTSIITEVLVFCNLNYFLFTWVVFLTYICRDAQSSGSCFPEFLFRDKLPKVLELTTGDH
jgi:hypothetical protein